jgi:hypothetical protein
MPPRSPRRPPSWPSCASSISASGGWVIAELPATRSGSKSPTSSPAPKQAASLGQCERRQPDRHQAHRRRARPHGAPGQPSTATSSAVQQKPTSARQACPAAWHYWCPARDSAEVAGCLTHCQPQAGQPSCCSPRPTSMTWWSWWC